MLDVAVVGGGICGLALAGRLAERGLDYEVYEARGRPGFVASLSGFRHQCRFWSNVVLARHRAVHGPAGGMGGALQEVVGAQGLREELFGAFAKLADWMRNDSGNPHDSQHGRHVLR